MIASQKPDFHATKPLRQPAATRLIPRAPWKQQIITDTGNALAAVHSVRSGKKHRPRQRWYSKAHHHGHGSRHTRITLAHCHRLRLSTAAKEPKVPKAPKPSRAWLIERSVILGRIFSIRIGTCG
jgi:hypothetical protein